MLVRRCGWDFPARGCSFFRSSRGGAITFRRPAPFAITSSHSSLTVTNTKLGLPVPSPIRKSMDVNALHLTARELKGPLFGVDRLGDCTLGHFAVIWAVGP